MGITPEFVRSVAGDGQPMPDVSKLMRAENLRPQTLARQISTSSEPANAP